MTESSAATASTPASEASHEETARLLVEAVYFTQLPPAQTSDIATTLAEGVNPVEVLRVLMQQSLRQRLSHAVKMFGTMPHLPGHYYSPHPDHDEARHAMAMRATAGMPAGIDYRVDDQMALWETLKPLLADTRLPFEPAPGQRFYNNNSFYRWGDASVLVAMLRHLKPRRFVEIGSGFSSALALDVAEQWLDAPVAFTFIDPFPERVNSLLRDTDTATATATATVLAAKVQHVDIEVFTRMEAGDILFVDSSHVLKCGNDLCHILFTILPALAPGVIIHFHDTFCHFEYPPYWVMGLRLDWNENYALRAFLMYNTAFQMMFFNDFMARTVTDDIAALLGQPAALPENLSDHRLGVGLWLRKTG